MNRVNLILILLLLGLGGESLAAQNCSIDNPNITPDSRYKKASDGALVIDKETGLMWMACSAGQTYDASASSCTGVPQKFVWKAALEYAEQTNQGSKANFTYTDWRLPSINELRSLGRHDCTTPAVNLRFFPNTQPNYYWSSSPTTLSASKAWGVGDGGGYRAPIEKLKDTFSYLPGDPELPVLVRLVRTYQGD